MGINAVRGYTDAMGMRYWVSVGCLMVRAGWVGFVGEWWILRRGLWNPISILLILFMAWCVLGLRKVSAYYTLGSSYTKLSSEIIKCNPENISVSLVDTDSCSMSRAARKIVDALRACYGMGYSKSISIEDGDRVITIPISIQVYDMLSSGWNVSKYIGFLPLLISYILMMAIVSLVFFI